MAGSPARRLRAALAALTLATGALFLARPAAAAGAQTSPTTDCPTAAASPRVEAGTGPTAPADPPADPSPGHARTLAFTGLETWRLLADGLLFISGGAALVLIARPPRRRLSTDSMGCVLVAGLVLNRLAESSAAGPSASCLPAAVLPEAPFGILLPLAAVGLFALAYFRRRRAKTAAAGT